MNSPKIIFLSFLLFAFRALEAQLNWQEVSSLYGILPPSVHVFKTTDSLNGRPFVAFYVRARLKDRKLDFTTAVGNGNRYTPSQYHAFNGDPLLVVNGTFFSFQSQQNLNLVMQEGKMLAYNQPSLKSKQSEGYYYPTRSAIGITRSRKADVAWVFTDTAKRWPYAFEARPVIAKGSTPDPSFQDLQTLDYWRWWKMRTAIGGGPVLLQKGDVLITYKEEQMFLDGLNDLHPRTAMGYTNNNELIILAIQGRAPGVAEGATLKEEALILQQLRCVEALNLDGGGSSCLLVNGKETIKPSDKEGQRAVPAVFLIRKKK
jgi:hypothetical protein